MIKFNNEFIKFAELSRDLTGSTMSNSEIYYKLNAVRPKTKKRIYQKVFRIVKNTDISFDEVDPLFVVYINILAVEEKIDPAVLLLVYLQ